MTREDLDDIKRHFNVVAESLDSKITAIAEGLSALDAKIDREVGGLREEMRRGFAETQAMIKFSYAELDRRVSALESSFAQLESRLSRLEKPPKAN